MARVVFTHGTITRIAIAGRRYTCDGHLAEPHWIERGERYANNAMPPNHPEFENDKWWRLRVCMECCPEELAEVKA